MVSTTGVCGKELIDHRIQDLWFDTIEDKDIKVAIPLVVSRSVSNEWYLC